MPQTPASPKPLRSTIFGGLIGLMLGIGLAFVRDSLDRRLRDSNEIQETLDLPVVGDGAHRGARATPRTSPTGAGR